MRDYFHCDVIKKKNRNTINFLIEHIEIPRVFQPSSEFIDSRAK